MKFLRRALLGAVFCAGLGLSACGGNAVSTPEAPTTPIRIGTIAWAGYSPLYIAAEKGLFEKEGVQVEIVNYATVQEADADFAVRKLEGNASTFQNGIAQAAAGIPIQTVWVFDNSVGADMLVGKSGIAGLEDLKGKRIGLAYGTFSHLFVVTALSNYGLSANDITIVNMQSEDVPQALRDDLIDAGHTWEPFVSEAVNEGGKVLFTTVETPGIVADVLWLQKAVIEKRPEDVQAVIRAIIAAQQWWQENPDEGNEIVGKALGADPKEIPAFLEGIKLFALSDNLASFDASNEGTESLYVNGRLTIELFQNIKTIDQAPDLQTIINASFVTTAAGN